MTKTAAQLDREIAEALARPAITPKMQAALASAARSGGKVGTGAYGARDERHPPATIRALTARGLLTPCSGNEGEMAGELTAAGRAYVGAGSAQPDLEPHHLTVRAVYSRSAQMPTTSAYVATLSPLHGKDIQFKREDRAAALRAALAYADARHITVENRELIEARLKQEGKQA